jgi:ClpP class serine protease
VSKKPDQFPRSKDLPSQSPLFWVEQKDRYLRQQLIRDIEEQTGRRLVVYFANRYENAQIDAKDPTYMAEALGDVKGQPLDLMLQTGGGQTDATEALISLIQNTIPDFRVIVVEAAKSNGTLLALAAKSVVMGPTSQLGPIEPSVQGIPCSILDTPETAATNFPLHMVGKFALKQTRTLAIKLLGEGMMKGRPNNEVQEAVHKLASRDTYLSHGSVIDCREATQLGLNVESLKEDDPLWQRLWLLHCMLDYDSRKGRYLKVFEGSARSTAVAAPPVKP